MSQSLLTEEPAREPTGGVLFLSAGELEEKIADCQRTGIFVVRVELSAKSRTRIEETIDDAVDSALAARGGSAPGVSTALDRDAASSDRIFRARRLGFCGIAVVVEALGLAATGHAALDAEDCAKLRAIGEMTRDRPLWLLFDRRDRDLGAHGRPIPFSAIFSPVPERRPVSTPISSPVSATVRIAERIDALKIVDSSVAATVGVAVATSDETWRGWMLALSAARGPQSIATFERLFVEAYLPLIGALSAGLDDPRAKASMLVFRRAFESAYPEAAARFQMTSKRPSMVLDAPQNAMRLARSNGAKMSQIVLVEAMRCDLGMLVRRALEHAMGGRATWVEDSRLHAALPTTSGRQLETIARGPEALRFPAAAPDDSTLPHVGAGLRKLRVGGREIFRLDTIDVAMQKDACTTLPRFEEIADDVAKTIAQHALALRTRTLLYILGDRGFSIDASGRVKCGGTTPEEVIVPAFAFVVAER